MPDNAPASAMQLQCSRRAKTGATMSVTAAFLLVSSLSCVQAFAPASLAPFPGGGKASSSQRLRAGTAKYNLFDPFGARFLARDGTSYTRSSSSLRPRRAAPAVHGMRMAASSTEKILSLLRTTGLGADEAAELIRCGKLCEAKPGEELLEEGRSVAVKRSLFIIIDGTVSVSRGGKPLAILGRGEFVGETSDASWNLNLKPRPSRLSRFLEVETLESLQQLRDSPLEEMFSMADKDKSGFIDAVELKKALQDVGIEISETQAAQILRKADLNNDGVMSLDEARQAVESIQGSTKRWFKRADLDGSASVDASELKNLLAAEGVDISVAQVQQLMRTIGGNVNNLSLTTAMKALQQLQQGSRLREQFKVYDQDSNGRIDEEEMRGLLNDLGLRMTSQQVSALFQEVDMNNDGLVEFREFESALDSVKTRILSRFGDAMKLYETVAYKTQQRAQVNAQASSKISFLRWDFADLKSYFNKYPSAASKIKNTWAVQLASRLQAASEQIRTSNTQDKPPSDLKEDAEPRDYGFGGEFTYGRAGDYGPLDKAVPAGAVRMSLWNFGREYRALRRFFRYDQFKEIVDALSGAGEWDRARDGLFKLIGTEDAEGRRQRAKEAFRAMDRDASGVLSVAELGEALGNVGITVSDEGVRRMIKAADSDRNDEMNEDEFVDMIEAVAQNKSKMKAAFSTRAGWLPGFIAKPILLLVEQLGKIDQEADAKMEKRVRPTRDSDTVSEETAKLREKLKLLRLDNEAVWKREEKRREMIRESLADAREESSNGRKTGSSSSSSSPSSSYEPLFVTQLTQTESPAIVLGPYFFLCWLLDVLFINRPIQRFWFLETVARMPYFSYITMLTLYESLGWWRASSDVRKIHFAEEWNEVQHLKIMEALGGDRLWLDRFLARHSALFYYVILNHIWLFSPSMAYNFSELIEFHAVDTYGEFVDTNEELLKSLPAPKEAVEYYKGQDKFLFDEFQTGRDPGSRRPFVRNLYDVFANIRDDELEHVKTMFQCQTAESQIISPNTRKAQSDY